MEKLQGTRNHNLEEQNSNRRPKMNGDFNAVLCAQKFAWISVLIYILISIALSVTIAGICNSNNSLLANMQQKISTFTDEFDGKGSPAVNCTCNCPECPIKIDPTTQAIDTSISTESSLTTSISTTPITTTPEVATTEILSTTSEMTSEVPTTETTQQEVVSTTPTTSSPTTITTTFSTTTNSENLVPTTAPKPQYDADMMLDKIIMMNETRYSNVTYGCVKVCERPVIIRPHVTIDYAVAPAETKTYTFDAFMKGDKKDDPKKEGRKYVAYLVINNLIKDYINETKFEEKWQTLLPGCDNVISETCK